MLSAMAHGTHPRREEVLDALVSALAAVDELPVLAARRIDVPDDVRARVIACTDTDTLPGWISRAATAHRIEDALG